MKIFILFIGTLCLMEGNHAQLSNIATILANTISSSMINLNSTIQSVNSTLLSADQITNNSCASFGNELNTLYSAYYAKYQNYTTIDLRPITSAIERIPVDLHTNKPQMVLDDTQFMYIFNVVRTSAQQIQDALNGAIVNMTAACGSSCDGTRAINCAKKYANQLTTAPFRIGRVEECITAEKSRFMDIAHDVAAVYSTSLDMVKEYVQLDKLCDTPSAAVLNNQTINMGTISTQCITTYLNRFASSATYMYRADYPRMVQMQLVPFRMTRCSKLVQLDIQDRINQVLDKYAMCLVTGV